MKYVDFKKFMDENEAKPIYIFEGEETYFRDKGEALIKNRFVQELTLDYASFDGVNVKGDLIRTLTDAVNCFPFISAKRVVRVTEFYPTEKEYQTYLKDLFENPPPDSILLIVNSAKAKAGQAALAKKPNVTYVDCSRADKETIKRWIYLTCKKSGIYADGVTCDKLAAYCIYDMSRIASETEKLLLYMQSTGQTRLTDEIVEFLVYPDSEYKIFELTAALSRKNYSEFMKIINDLSVKGYNETALLSTLVSYFRNLYETSLLQGSDKEVATVLGVPEFVAQKNREQAAKFSKGALEKIYQTVYRAVSDIKCGVLTPSAALKMVIARLFFGK